MDDYHHSTTCRRNNTVPASGRFGAVNGSLPRSFGRSSRPPELHSYRGLSMHKLGYNMQDLAYSILSIYRNLSIENVFSFRFQDSVNVYSGARARQKIPAGEPLLYMALSRFQFRPSRYINSKYQTEVARARVSNY